MARPWLWLSSSAIWLATQLVIAQPPVPASPDVELDRMLATDARLSWIERLALARHPALREARERVLAGSERARGADRFPDLELKYELWAVPLNRPYALNRADTLMFGVRQAFPAAGTRQARARAAAAEVELGQEQRHALQRDLVLRVRRAYFDYYAADRVLQAHQQHLGLAEQMAAQVRSSYAVGRGSQQDLLKILVEVSRLHNALAETRQQRESARLLLNALMARSPDAPLGPPADLPRPPANLDIRDLDKSRAAQRPELAAARSAVRRSDALLDGAKDTARWPAFMFGADYWLMPTQDMPHAYGAMVSMSLPWLNRARRADVREAEHLASAERRAADAVEIETAFELHDAMARLAAANVSLEVIERDLLPQADKSLQAARASYAVGQTDLLSLLDAMRSYFQVQLEHGRALSRVMAQVADLEFASGAHLFDAAAPEKSHE